MNRYDDPSPAELEENKRSLARMIENDKRRSDEMKCKCGHELYTHRGKNTECHGIDVSKAKTYIASGSINWSDPNIWCKCKRYGPVAKLANAADLKSVEETPLEGSTPSGATIQTNEFKGLTRVITEEELEFLRKSNFKFEKENKP